MIKKILRLLNDSEKKYFNFIFILLCINSFFELVSLAVFYPTLSILFDENYDFTKIDDLLNNFDIQIINFNGYLYLFFGLIFIIFLIKNVFFMYFIYKQN